MTTDEEAIKIATKFGIHNADLVIKAAKKAGLPRHVGFALMQMESNGENIWGADAGGTFSGRKGEVTEALYKEFRHQVIDLGKRSNGVGPSQITWAGSLVNGKHTGGFFTDMEKKGLKPWDTFDNMYYGFSLIAEYYAALKSYAKAGTRYNGATAYGTTFSRRVTEWKNRLGAAVETPTEESTMVATSGKGWKLAPSLVQLVKDVDAKYPKRDKSWDGSIGDASHAARASEHNPDHDSDPMPEGYVSAVDITKDSAEMAKFLLSELIGDDRVWYVIHDGFIYSRTHNWEKRKYTGASDHAHHVHVSLRQTKDAANATGKWFDVGTKPPADPKPEPKPSAKKLPVLSIKDKDAVLVPFLKRFYGMSASSDPTFTRALLGKVRTYQKNHHLVVDGVVGTKTWTKIAGGGTKLPDGYKL